MKITSITSQQPNFQAKISPKFEHFMRDYINNGANRKQYNYRLSQKIAELDSFGYDEYTLNLTTRFKNGRNRCVIVATKNQASIKDGIYLLERGTFQNTLNCFLNLTKKEFDFLMKLGRKYKD